MKLGIEKLFETEDMVTDPATIVEDDVTPDMDPELPAEPTDEEVVTVVIESPEEALSIIEEQQEQIEVQEAISEVAEVQSQVEEVVSVHEEIMEAEESLRMYRKSFTDHGITQATYELFENTGVKMLTSKLIGVDLPDYDTASKNSKNVQLVITALEEAEKEGLGAKIKQLAKSLWEKFLNAMSHLGEKIGMLLSKIKSGATWLKDTVVDGFFKVALSTKIISYRKAKDATKNISGDLDPTEKMINDAFAAIKSEEPSRLEKLIESLKELKEKWISKSKTVKEDNAAGNEAVGGITLADLGYDANKVNDVKEDAENLTQKVSKWQSFKNTAKAVLFGAGVAVGALLGVVIGLIIGIIMLVISLIMFVVNLLLAPFRWLYSKFKSKKSEEGGSESYSYRTPDLNKYAWA